MLKKNYHKKYGYEEYFVNDTFLKKLFGMYVEKHFLGKVLDILVFFAIISTVMAVVLEYLGEVHTIVHVVVHSFSALILFIFVLELIRNYANSKNKIDFFKHHWMDFILVAFLSFYFVFITFLDILKFFIFDFLKPLFQDAKHVRLFFKMFRR